MFVEEYQQRYRFMLREPVTAFSPANADNLFVAVYAGAFATGEKHDYVRGTFTRAFAATELCFDASTFEKSLQPNALTPLRAGSLQLDVDGQMEDATLLLLDPRRPSDVIEYWNLRAVGRSIIGIPVDWAEYLVPWYQRFIDERYQPLPVNPNVMLFTTLMAAHADYWLTSPRFRH